MSLLLPLVFFGIAFLYSMAGFGGGSSYIAILAISGFPLTGIPVLALSCNLVVASQGSVILARAGHLNIRLLLPLLCASVPSAFVTGSLRIHSETYLWILTLVLTAAGTALLVPTKLASKDPVKRRPVELFLIGGILGGLAGISGIGGGIFLAPVLHLMRAEKARDIAGAASLFIALNSLAGLLGQFTKGLEPLGGIPMVLYIVCPLAVIAGGFPGSRLLAKRLSPVKVRAITGIVVLLVAARLWIKLTVGL